MSEPLYKDGEVEDDNTSEKHDGFDVFGSVFGKVHIWIALLMFILYILINTSTFIEEVLKKINSEFVSIDGNPTTNGIIVQGIFLSIGYIIIDLLVSSDVL